MIEIETSKSTNCPTLSALIWTCIFKGNVQKVHLIHIKRLHISSETLLKQNRSKDNMMNNNISNKVIKKCMKVSA